MIVEQPGSSLLARHPRFQELCDAHKAMCFHAGRQQCVLFANVQFLKDDAITKIIIAHNLQDSSTYNVLRRSIGILELT